MDSRRIQTLKLAMRKVASHLFLTTLFLTSIFLSSAQAAPGDLDLTFGTNGTVYTFDGYYQARAQAIAIQSDGKAVAAGVHDDQFTLVRFNIDGSLDTSFGAGGIVTPPLQFFSQAVALVIQPDGKLIAAGGLNIVRFNANGTLDTTFGIGGIVHTESSGLINFYALAIQSDGKLVAAGGGDYFRFGAGNDGTFTLARYHTDGSLDTSFGNAGIVTKPIGSYSSAEALAIQPDGKIVVTGESSVGFFLARFNTNGDLDGDGWAYGSGGIIYPPLGSHSVTHALAIQSDGKIVVTGDVFLGYSPSPTIGFVLIRYNPDGRLDYTFGGSGIVITPMSGLSKAAHVMALTIQLDGKLVAGGGWHDLDAGFPVVRYNTNGSLDTSFGTNGMAFPLGPCWPCAALAMAIQSDGKIVAAGYPGFVLVRLLGDPTVSAVGLTPANTISAPGVQQSFTVVFSDPDGYQNISDASIHITDLAGGPHDEWVHYNPQTNSFTMLGATGSCPPAGSGSLSTSFLTLNCSTSTASGSGTQLAVSFNLTPQPSFSGPLNSMFITATDQGGASNGKIGGYWIVDRPPSVDGLIPVNISTPVGTAQSFTAGFSDPDGYLNISDAGLYLAAGPHNEWVHYSPTANKFTLMGVNGSCSPGQAITLSNSSLSLNCATSGAFGSGATLTVIYNLTPLAGSAGTQFLQVPATIDSAGKNNGKILGTWRVLSF